MNTGAPATRRLPLAAETAVVAALGALQTLAFVHVALPLAWALPILALAALVRRLDVATPGRAAVLAAAYGTGWLLAGVWWLFISLHRYGGMPAWMAVFAVLALALSLSAYLAVAGAAYARWRGGGAGDAALFAALWLLTELARGIVFTGFPWLAAGYSQVDAPLAALAPWIGVYGIGAVLAYAAAGLASLAASRGRRWRPAAAAAFVFAAAGVAGPGEHTRAAGEIEVALLQANVRQDEKFDAVHLPQILEWVGRELVVARADLVIAPETAVPLLPFQLEVAAPGYWSALQAHFEAAGRAALVGVPLGDHDSGYTNSVAGLSAAGSYRYDKHHLVPFGEFIPTGFRWFTEMMNIPLGDFARGTVDPPSFAVRGQRVAPNICYEDLFGEELARRFLDPARAPTLFANLSNIGWFGDTIATVQHLHISRLRALEFQRPMVRATNTGATAIIDHRGVVAAMLPPHTRGVLVGRVQGRDGVTPYAWWAARAGLWPLVLVALAVLVVCSTQRRRGAEAKPEDAQT